MALVTQNLRLVTVALGAVLAVLPLSSGACGNTACLVYSQAQYEASNGCPSAKNALQMFTSPSCPGAVTKVDGAGSFDGEYCCYAVTQQSMDNLGCVGGEGGFAGFGGAGGEGAFGGFAGSAGCLTQGGACASDEECCTGLICDEFNVCDVGGGGAGGSGGAGGGCNTCNTELADLGSSASDLCGAAAPFWDSLVSCSCSGGACAMACSPTFCDGTVPDAMCSSCLQSTTSGCGTELTACQSN